MGLIEITLLSEFFRWEMMECPLLRCLLTSYGKILFIIFLYFIVLDSNYIASLFLQSKLKKGKFISYLDNRIIRLLTYYHLI